MKAPTASKEQILAQLHELDPAEGQEVLDFTGDRRVSPGYRRLYR